MDFKLSVANEIMAAIIAAYGETTVTAQDIASALEIPPDTAMGDYAFPCFKLAKILRKAPPMIAKGIAEAIADDPMFEKIEQVTAYVNMFVSKEEFAKEVVSEVIEKEAVAWAVEEVTAEEIDRINILNSSIA